MFSKIIISPSILKGRVKIPPSKSMLHRYLIGAALSENKIYIKNVFKSEDIISTIEVLKKIGTIFEEEKINSHTSNYYINSFNVPNIKKNDNIFNCKESGSTLRFIIPILLLTGKEFTVKGSGRLVERPLNVFYDLFYDKNIMYKNNNGKLPLFIKGKLIGGVFNLKGDVSSQFITGLLFALPLAREDSIIKITTKIESRPYIQLTLDILNIFNIKINVSNDFKIFKIDGNQKYILKKSVNSIIDNIEGDFSHAAFFAVSGMIGKNPIICEGLNQDSLQGDKIILNILKKMGGNLEIKENYTIFYPSITKGIKINVEECPDLVPPLSLLGSLSLGETIITGAKRLKMKESDRLKSSSFELNKLGANISVENEGLKIKGIKNFNGNIISNSWNDHRIAMMIAIASSRINNPIYLNNWQSVNKSYPNFWEDFKNLGGIINE